MEEFRDKLLQHLSEINASKDNIREGLKRSRATYEAFRKHQRRKQCLNPL